jgi:hypothetical protein
MGKKTGTAIAACIAFLLCAAAQAQDNTAADAVARHLEALASDGMQGRAAGSLSARRAAAYIQAEFQAMGLRTEIQEFGGKYRNVLAYIPGEGEGAIVIGAHYDGKGKSFGSILNGADDNASGVAAIIETARILSAKRLSSSVILAAFDGEEIGLLGSRNFVMNHPGNDIRLMFSVDMVGHLRDEARLVYEGTASIQGGADIIRSAHVDGLSPKCEPVAVDSGVMTDSYFFAARKIPAINVSTYVKESNYHKATDDIETLDIPGIALVAEQLGLVVEGFQDRMRPTGVPLYGGRKPQVVFYGFRGSGYVADSASGGDAMTLGRGLGLNAALPLGFILGLGDVSALGGFEYENLILSGSSGGGWKAFSLPLGFAHSVKILGLELCNQVSGYYRLTLDDRDSSVHHGGGVSIRCQSSVYSTIDPINRLAVFFESGYGYSDIDLSGFRFLNPFNSFDIGVSFRF